MSGMAVFRSSSQTTRPTLLYRSHCPQTQIRPVTPVCRCPAGSSGSFLHHSPVSVQSLRNLTSAQRSVYSHPLAFPDRYPENTGCPWTKEPALVRKPPDRSLWAICPTVSWYISKRYSHIHNLQFLLIPDSHGS